MSIRAKSAAVLGAAAAILSLSAAPAMASTVSAQDSGDRSYTDGCFSIKVLDGYFSDTIYYHNNCDRAERLTIIYGSSEKDVNVGAHEKGNWSNYSTNISDAYDDGTV